jgi:hypothetical protein
MTKSKQCWQRTWLKRRKGEQNIKVKHVHLYAGVKGLQWQTLVRGDIGRQRLFRPLANPGEVEASCVFRALMRYEVKQHDFKMFEGDS